MNAAAESTSLVRGAPFRIGELRGAEHDPPFRQAVWEGLGVELPAVGKTSGSGKGITVLGLGPDRWWLKAPPGSAEVPGLSERRPTERPIVIDLSAGLESLTLTGPAAEEILARGVAIDLHIRGFPPGEVRRTLHAGVPLVIHRTGDGGTTFDVHSGRSFGHYLSSWLAKAGEEFDLQITSWVEHR